MIGITAITAINGFPLPIDKQFSQIKNAGFESILLWWGTGEKESRAERVATAKKYGLHTENAHTTTDNLNAPWSDGQINPQEIMRWQNLIRKL